MTYLKIKYVYFKQCSIKHSTFTCYPKEIRNMFVQYQQISNTFLAAPSINVHHHKKWLSWMFSDRTIGPQPKATIGFTLMWIWTVQTGYCIWSLKIVLFDWFVKSYAYFLGENSCRLKKRLKYWVKNHYWGNAEILTWFSLLFQRKLLFC